MQSLVAVFLNDLDSIFIYSSLFGLLFVFIFDLLLIITIIHIENNKSVNSLLLFFLCREVFVNVNLGL